MLAAPHLFDEPPTAEWTDRFLTADGHHLLFARLDGADVGFVTGVEMTHPDKGTEMFLYELGVDDAARGQGVGKALVAALRDLAEERGCYGMWVLTDADNEAAIRTYQAAGGSRARPAGPPRLDLRPVGQLLTCGRGGPASSGRTRPG